MKGMRIPQTNLQILRQCCDIGLLYFPLGVVHLSRLLLNAYDRVYMSYKASARSKLARTLQSKHNVESGHLIKADRALTRNCKS